MSESVDANTGVMASDVAKQLSVLSSRQATLVSRVTGKGKSDQNHPHGSLSPPMSYRSERSDTARTSRQENSPPQDQGVQVGRQIDPVEKRPEPLAPKMNGYAPRSAQHAMRAMEENMQLKDTVSALELQLLKANQELSKKTALAKTLEAALEKRTREMEEGYLDEIADLRQKLEMQTKINVDKTAGWSLSRMESDESAITTYTTPAGDDSVAEAGGGHPLETPTAVFVTVSCPVRCFSSGALPHAQTHDG
eukprot:191499-Rhodomonas_salina.2